MPHCITYYNITAMFIHHTTFAPGIAVFSHGLVLDLSLSGGERKGDEGCCRRRRNMHCARLRHQEIVAGAKELPIRRLGQEVAVLVSEYLDETAQFVLEFGGHPPR
jgi:hypothetical protein